MKHPAENLEKHYHFLITEYEILLPFFLVGAGWKYRQDLDPYTRPEGYHSFQWIQCESGEGLLTLGEQSYRIQPGDAFFLFPHVPHAYRSWQSLSPWVVNWFTFQGQMVETTLNTLGLRESKVFRNVNSGILKSRIKKAFDLLTTRRKDKSYRGSAITYDFIVEMGLAIKESALEKTGYNRLKPVISYIQNHSEDLITIDDLSDIIKVSPQYLCQLFQQILGSRPMDFINAIRIKKSKISLLKYPYFSITQIAQESGINSCSYFCKLFRRYEGISPQSFREQSLGQWAGSKKQSSQ